MMTKAVLAKRYGVDPADPEAGWRLALALAQVLHPEEFAPEPKPCRPRGRPPNPEVAARRFLLRWAVFVARVEGRGAREAIRELAERWRAEKGRVNWTSASLWAEYQRLQSRERSRSRPRW